MHGVMEGVEGVPKWRDDEPVVEILAYEADLGRKIGLDSQVFRALSFFLGHEVSNFCSPGHTVVVVLIASLVTFHFQSALFTNILDKELGGAQGPVDVLFLSLRVKSTVERLQILLSDGEIQLSDIRALIDVGENKRVGATSFEHEMQLMYVFVN